MDSQEEGHLTLVVMVVAVVVLGEMAFRQRLYQQAAKAFKVVSLVYGTVAVAVVLVVAMQIFPTLEVDWVGRVAVVEEVINVLVVELELAGLKMVYLVK